MQIEIGQKVNHKILGSGEVTDVYEHENGSTYFDVHFDAEDQSRYSKYKVHTFNIDSAEEWFA